jgi:hypothetical protein
VLAGRATFLGKGDDGLAFKVGSKVVKVSTTVPYQPDNAGHLSPAQAIERLRKQTEVHNRIASLVGPSVQPATFVRHGDKGFQVKPYVTIPPKLSRTQLDQVQDAVIAIHRAGYVVGDEIQVGLDAAGRMVLFDLGKASPLGKEDDGYHGPATADRQHLAELYRRNGERFVRRDIDEGEVAWKNAVDIAFRSKPGAARGFARDAVTRAAEKRRQYARASLSGAKLAMRLAEIDKDEEVELYLLAD